MLILTRKAGQAVDLLQRATGDPIATVEVLGTLADGSIRLGFRAGQDIKISRAEGQPHGQWRFANGNEEDADA